MADQNVSQNSQGFGRNRSLTIRCQRGELRKRPEDESKLGFEVRALTECHRKHPCEDISIPFER